MSILRLGKKHDGSADDESDALVEFLGKQDLSSVREFQEYIKHHNDLFFVWSEKPPGESAPRQTAELAYPVQSDFRAGGADEDQPLQAEKRPRKPRLPVASVNASVFYVFWLLLLVIAVRFIEFPLNYIMGAAFIAPVIMRLLPLLRNARQSS